MSDLSAVPGGQPVGERPWAAWTPREVAKRLNGAMVPWCVAAGHACGRAMCEKVQKATQNCRFSHNATPHADKVDVAKTA